MRLIDFEKGTRQKRPTSGILLPTRRKCQSSLALVTIRKPFLKWAGAKTRISQLLKTFMPSGDHRFVEPFVGSGAVFLNTGYQRGVLADVNSDVINLYRLLQEHGEGFISSCRDLFNSETNREDRFYELRNEFNASGDKFRRASLFVYLNRHCFNGLCRFNQSGEFNTPFGRYEHPYFPATEMSRFAERLKTADLRASDFRQTFLSIESNDIVYCDPPYLPTSTSSFTQYSGEDFSLQDHRDLASLAEQATEKGATILISNHDTVVARDLYKRASTIVPLLVSRTISCHGHNRQKAKEIIAIYRPPNEHTRRTRQ